MAACASPGFAAEKKQTPQANPPQKTAPMPDNGLTPSQNDVFNRMSKDMSVGSDFNQALNLSDKEGGCGGAPSKTTGNADCWKKVLANYDKRKSKTSLLHESSTLQGLKSLDDKKTAGKNIYSLLEKDSKAYDGSKSAPAVNLTPGKGQPETDKKDEPGISNVEKKRAEEAKRKKNEAEKEVAKKLDETPGDNKPPAHGALTADPKAKTPDPNRWNSTIFGAKGAIYGGLLGFIFGGPVGALVFGALGFGAAYFVHKMNN